MELLGEEVSQRGRRGPPFIQGEPIQPLPPKQPRRGRYYRRGQRYYRWTQRYYRSPLRYYRPAWEGLKIEEGPAQRGTAAVVGRYYRSRAVLPHLLPLQVPLNPTREVPPSSRGGSGPVPQRYCR